MNAKWMSGVVIPVATLVGLFGSPKTAQAQVTKSDLTVDKVVVTPVPLKQNQWSIEVDGTMTLGPKDTFVGLKVKLTDPSGVDNYPFLNAPPPAQGKSSQYTATLQNTAIKGQWTYTVTMAYVDANGMNQYIILAKGFQVGPQPGGG